MKKRNVLIVLAVLIGIVSIIGISYAYWMLSLTQTDKNTLASACFSIEFTDADDINLQNAYPISDSEGEALTPYTFTITNKCNDYASYQVNLEVLNTTTLNTNYVKTKFNNNISLLKDYEVVTKTLEDATTSYKLLTGELDKNESVTYDLRLWLDYDTPASDDSMNKLFTSKITITASYLEHVPTEYELCVEQNGVVQCNILADVDTTGSCPTVNADGTVNVTRDEITNGYICSAPDDYGTSYYYRGNVKNNYVKFGGYYWRILRVNGDGSIRMIYAGDASVIDALDETTKQTVLANGYKDSTTKYTQIGESKYNSSYGNNAYVGYMYGDNIWGEGIKSETFSKEMNNTNYYYASTYSFDATTGKYTLGADAAKGPWGADKVGKYTNNSKDNEASYSIYKIDSFVDNTYGNAYLYIASGSNGIYTDYHNSSLSKIQLGTRKYYATGYKGIDDGEFELVDYSYGAWDESKVGYYTCDYNYYKCSTLYYIESYDDAVNGTVSSMNSWTGTTYEETHKNERDSTIKQVVDNWYKDHFLGKDYEQYISDTLFCNDRSISPYRPDSSYLNTGIGEDATLYRWMYDPLDYIMDYTIKNNPTLNCKQQNDRFTRTDTTVGNGALNYPIGLISNDEIVLAGGYSYDTSNYYLYTGNYCWTMSPSYYRGDFPYVRQMFPEGFTGSNYYVLDSYGVRPVINLKAGSLKVGTGVWNDPYMVAD